MSSKPREVLEMIDTMLKMSRVGKCSMAATLSSIADVVDAALVKPMTEEEWYEERFKKRCEDMFYDRPINALNGAEVAGRLKTYPMWRRGKPPYDGARCQPFTPKELGAIIDRAIELLEESEVNNG